MSGHHFSDVLLYNMRRIIRNSICWWKKGLC